MKSFRHHFVILFCLVTGLVVHLEARADDPVTPNPSSGQAALDQAIARDKYLFVLFYRRDDAATQSMRQTIEGAVSRDSSRADWVSIDVSNQAEKRWIDNWKLSRAPMPMAMVIAPNRAVTGAFPLKATSEQIEGAIVSRATAACLLAGQTKKLVLLCVHPGTTFEAPAGVKEFQEDSNYGPATEVVAIRADDAAEAKFLTTLKLTPKESTQVALIAPPGMLLSSFPQTVTKEQLVTSLKSAQNSCCPGGSCVGGSCRVPQSAVTKK